jgi:hypothetical protein
MTIEMAPEEHAGDPEASDAPPEPADVWVWGVRQVAGVVGQALLAARWLALLFILLEGLTWLITQNPDAVRDAGIGCAIFVALWAGGLFLGRFAAERDSPDPTRWFFRRRSR